MSPHLAGLADLTGRLDPGNAEARRWLEEELSSAADRERTDPLQRLIDAIERGLDSLLSADPSSVAVLPSTAAGVVTALVVGLLLFSLRWVRRERRAPGAPEAVLGVERLTAAAFRERAAAALREGRYAAAVTDAMRAVAAGGAERTLLDDAPSLTAHEVALRLATPFPASAAELAWAADAFDAVVYGHREVGRPEAERLLALDRSIAATRPVVRREPAGAAATGTADGGSR
jgi:hypothetical protein